MSGDQEESKTEIDVFELCGKGGGRERRYQTNLQIFRSPGNDFHKVSKSTGLHHLTWQTIFMCMAGMGKRRNQILWKRGFRAQFQKYKLAPGDGHHL